jgi:hypothetical protein
MWVTEYIPLLTKSRLSMTTLALAKEGYSLKKFLHQYERREEGNKEPHHRNNTPMSSTRTRRSTQSCIHPHPPDTRKTQEGVTQKTDARQGTSSALGSQLHPHTYVTISSLMSGPISPTKMRKSPTQKGRECESARETGRQRPRHRKIHRESCTHTHIHVDTDTKPHTHRHTDTHTHTRKSHRQTDRQTDRHTDTDTHTHRHTDTQTHRHGKGDL